MLKVYHASAGTGKTFALVLNYLTLLMRDPEKYRHILAVTFTNKATAEMKGRIVRVLFGLSKTGLSGYEHLEEVQEAAAYLKNMPEELKESREMVRNRAVRALRMILYDYSSFSVQTIDSFFQRVLRGFARELNLQFGYNIELDTKTTLERVVDLFMKSVDEKPMLLEWLVKFMDEESEESGKWDIRKLIVARGNQIFSEQFKMITPGELERITDKDFIGKEYLRRLQQIIHVFDQRMQAYGREGLTAMEAGRVEVSDFSSGKNGVAGIFQKLANGNYKFGKRFLGALGDSAVWLTAKNRRDPWLTQVVDEHLQPLIIRIYTYFMNNYTAYYTALAIRSQIYMLGILSDLRSQLFRWMREENLFLITEVGAFIREVIGQNEMPFIYEKLGQVYRHYMIDEFQDTSYIQYENLKPLVKNSISSGYLSLIVGDIKQSIYRWRNGDWEIMGVRLPRDFAGDQMKKKILKHNNRSLEKVVRFNNAFFISAPVSLWTLYESGFKNFLKEHPFFERIPGLDNQKAILDQIYSGDEVTQEVVPGRQGGYVSVRFLEDNGDDDWKKKASKKVAEKIETLLSEGYHPGQIVLLVRTNEEGREITRFLLERQNAGKNTSFYPLVSEDSLYLTGSVAVRFVVAFIRYLSDPEDLLNFAVLWYLYVQITDEEAVNGLPRYHEKLLEEVRGPERIFTFIPPVTPDWIARLYSLPLTETVQEIIRFFSLHERAGEVPFLYTFQNLLTDFINKKSAAPAAFLDWWDEQGDTVSLQMPEEVEAVRVMTIHKAKGLGAEVVIIPYADWNFEHNGGRESLWCRPQEEPFNRISMVPVNYRKELLKTYFRKDYLNEHFAKYIDSLNLLYVAFTRAGERLYVYSVTGKRTGDTARLLKETLQSVITGRETHDKLQKAGLHVDETGNIFEAGDLFSPGTVASAGGVVVDRYPVHTAFDRLRIVRQGQRFFILTGAGYQEKIDRGNLYHTLLAGIRTKEDLEPVLRQSVAAGQIPKADFEPMKTEIGKFLQQPDVEDWFSGKWEVRNEATIIHQDGRMLRPDRVMIRENEVVVVDYKFGETEEEQYVSQVRKYVESLKNMGYKNVSGVIWYVLLNKRIRVDG